MKTLVLFRGLPGSGKSTLAEWLFMYVFSADDFFYNYLGEYHFDASLLKDAHQHCQNNVQRAMESEVESIGVANTFTQEWEMEPYFNLAKTYGYRVHTVIVENRHGSTNVHNVPEQTVQKMKDRFEIKL